MYLPNKLIKFNGKKEEVITLDPTLALKKKMQQIHEQMFVLATEHFKNKEFK